MPEDGGGPADGGAKPTLTEFKISVDSLQCLGGQIVAVQPYRQSPANYVEAVSTI